MAPKTKKQAEPTKVEEEPAAKKAKAEEPKKEEPKKEEPKEEEPKFQEPDAPKDSRPASTTKIGFETASTTLNVIPTLGGKMLTALNDGGMAFLIAGAKANVGQKAGRYMFEVKVVQQSGNNNQQAKNVVRIGFSTAESGLILGEDSHSVYFDTSDSVFVAAKKRTGVKNGRIAKDQVAAVVLNLDPKSPNKNTVALYRDGVAASEPMPLPEELQGKTLFPHVAYRGASVQVNFGATALKELSFKCRSLQGAAASDVSVAASKDSKDGKYEVLMPVAFPDEGTFAWLDAFLEKNPSYVELSDRKIIAWAKASGIHEKGSYKVSNDKPNPQFGIQGLDDMSVRKVISTMAPIIPRNYVVMEVKANLVADERKQVLKKFNYPCYKKVARVIMGEPNKEFKAVVQNKLLKDKQMKSDNVFKAKKAEAIRKKAAEARAKLVLKQKKEAEKKRAAILAEKKKKAEEEKKAKEGGEEKKEEEKKDEPMEEKKAESEEEKEEPEAPEEETEPPVVELTDEEKQQFFFKGKATDLTPQVLAASFAKFTTPEADEGFDDIVYEWSKADKAEAYLKDWVMKKKLTTKIEDIKPGKAFREKVTEFNKLTKEWKEKLAAFKASGKKAKKGEDAQDIDIFSVTDVNDIGAGVPLFEQFTFEDWALMEIRFQFCLLVLSFKVDCNDPDRTGIPADHLSFYFQKYYGNLNLKKFGVANNTELLALIKDGITTKDGLVVSQLSDDLENLDIFLKLTEEQRRERQRRIDAGDETARLKFTQPPAAVAKPEAKPAATPAAKTDVAAKTPAPKAATAPAKKGFGKGKW